MLELQEAPDKLFFWPVHRWIGVIAHWVLGAIAQFDRALAWKCIYQRIRSSEEMRQWRGQAAKEQHRHTERYPFWLGASSTIQAVLVSKILLDIEMKWIISWTTWGMEWLLCKTRCQCRTRSSRSRFRGCLDKTLSATRRRSRSWRHWWWDYARMWPVKARRWSTCEILQIQDIFSFL